MIKEIGSYRFPGFYESLFCYADEFYDDEKDLEFEISANIHSNDFEVCYEYIDFDKYKIDVCNRYMDVYIEKIIEVLPSEITDNEHFKLEKIEDSLDIYSPQYYNYSTDRCYCEIDTNIETLRMIKDHTLKLNGVQKYILDHFTSYDGFISFISNNFDTWKETNIEDYEENMLICLLDMLIDLSDCTAFYNLKEKVFYDIDKYYYVDSIVYCNEEIAKKILTHYDSNITIKIKR